MKYKHLFFDLDHTLWDFETASHQTWKSLYESHQLSSRGIPDFEDFFRVYSGYNDIMWAQFRAGELTREELRWKRIWKALLDFNIYDTPLSKNLSEAYLELLPTQAYLMPYAREVLDYCKEKYKLHLITNGFEKTQKLKLEHAGINRHFLEMFSSERCDSMKPQAEIFRFALNTVNADCSECLMIGDALDVDIIGAMNVGIDTVYFNPARVHHNKKPSYEIAHLKDLLNIL